MVECVGRNVLFYFIFSVRFFDTMISSPYGVKFVSYDVFLLLQVLYGFL